MRVVEHASASEFLASTERFRGQEPVLTNVIGSVAMGVAAGSRYDTELWLSVHDGPGAHVVGIAMRTAPHNVVVSPMPPAAAAALGARLAVIDPELPGVAGPPAVTEVLLEAFGAGDRAYVAMRERILVLGDLVGPGQPVAGRARRVDRGDAELVADWMVTFAADAGLRVRRTRSSIVASMHAPEPPAMWLWEREGEPVSLAGHAALVETPVGRVGRVGPVYTPAPLRGRGFGSAVTHAVADRLRRECAIVMLYTDATNPISNSVYERLGFAVVGEAVEVQLAPVGGPGRSGGPVGPELV